MKTFLPVLLTIVVSAMIQATASSAETTACNVVHVPVIKDINLVYDGMKSITITASGEVPTTGYTNVVLVRRIYVVPPPDGVWEYDMFACKPSGIVAQVITPVTQTDKWEGPPKGLKGIRVFGSTTPKEVPVNWP